jgi:ribose transport system permease protein
MNNADLAEAESAAAPVAAAAEPALPPARHLGRLSFSDITYRYGLLLAWASVIFVFSVLRPGLFFTASNFQTMASSQASLLILTLGLLLPLTVGEFDASVAGVMSITIVLVGYLNVLHHWPIGLAILAALAAATVIGMVHAFLIIKVEVESIIVTLGSGTLLVGLGFGLNELAVSGISEPLVSVARHHIFGIQDVFYFGLALTIAMWYVFSYTPLGRYLYFVGSGPEVARLAGIRVDLIRAGSLIAASLISAVAGILLVGIQGGADPQAGGPYLLPAFSGAFLGATAIRPGRFNPWGTFIAVYFLVTGITGLELLGLSGWIEQVFYGASLVAAVTFSRLAGRRRTVTA